MRKVTLIIGVVFNLIILLLVVGVGFDAIEKLLPYPMWGLPTLFYAKQTGLLAATLWVVYSCIRDIVKSLKSLKKILYD